MNILEICSCSTSSPLFRSGRMGISIAYKRFCSSMPSSRIILGIFSIVLSHSHSSSGDLLSELDTMEILRRSLDICNKCPVMISSEHWNEHSSMRVRSINISMIRHHGRSPSKVMKRKGNSRTYFSYLYPISGKLLSCFCHFSISRCENSSRE